MCLEANVNHSHNNENYIQDDCMENHGSNDDHAHVHEQINIEPNAREILNSINRDSNGEPHGNDILHMAMTSLNPSSRCSILQAVLSLLNLKVVHVWTSNSFTDLL